MESAHTPKKHPRPATPAAKKELLKAKAAKAGTPLFLQRKEEMPSQSKLIQRQDDGTADPVMEEEKTRLGQINFDKAESEIPQLSSQAERLPAGMEGPKTAAQTADEALSGIVYAVKEEMRVKKAWGKPTDTTIVIAGLASQEGESKFNQKLSKQRAEALKVTLMGRLKASKIETSKVTIITTGLGVGKQPEGSYHIDRKATVYVVKRSLKLNKPGEIIAPDLTEYEKIRYIKERIQEGDKTALKAEQYVSAMTLMTSMASDVLPLPGYTNPKRLERESYLKIYKEYKQLKARE
ncbi:MAG: hypothetical protein AAGL17_10075 [Cyanobacteria bacterium J06576_12]